MNNYRFLNLPKNPLRDLEYVSDENLAKWAKINAQSIHPTTILSNELLDIFATHKLIPAFCVIFTTCQHTGVIENRLMHSDICLKDGKWIKMYSGVNYELNDTENEFMWFKTKLPEVYPDAHSLNPSDINFNGIHYFKRRRFGLDSEKITQKLEGTEIKGPCLVRTDIPHLITYNSPTMIRKSLSIRFEETWNSWDEAVEAFTPLLKV